MGALLAVFLTVALNAAPLATSEAVVRSYVTEGVGLRDDATEYRVVRLDGATWQLYDGFGAAWYRVAIDGDVLRLTDPASGEVSERDVGAVLGLGDGAWWEADAIVPPNGATLVVERAADGAVLSLDGRVAGELRW